MAKTATTPKLKLGSKVRILRNSRGIAEGTTGYITSIPGRYTTNSYVSVADETGYIWSLIVRELELIPMTREEIGKEMDKLKVEIDDLQLKIDYMDQAGEDEYDENEFKVWKTLHTLDNKKLSEKEKIKIIAGLIG